MAGLYLAVIVALGAWVLKRLWDPVPWRVGGFFAVLVVALFPGALVGNRVLLPLDILPGLAPAGEAAPKVPHGNPLQLDLVTEITPWLAEVRRAVGDGRWPLWNPDAGAGVPLLANPQTQAFQPLVLAAWPLPLHRAVAVTAALRVLSALVFFFLLLNRQGLGQGPALFGSVSYGLSSFLLLWLGWPLANGAALLPLLLYALVMTDVRGLPRDLALLLAAAVAVLLCGHPEAILYCGLAAALFAASRLRARQQERGTLALRWAGVGLLALGIAAPVLLPAAKYLPQSHRRALVEQRNERLGRGGELPAGWSALPRRAAPVAAPYAFGDGRSWRGEANLNEDAAGFAGSAALLAALAALLPARRRFPEERLAAVLAAVSFVVMLRPPPLARLLAAVPVLDQSASSHQRIALLFVFSLAYLAACTAERWTMREGRTAAFAVAAVVAGAAACGYLAWPVPEGEARQWAPFAVQLLALGAVAALLWKKMVHRGWLLAGVAAFELLVLFTEVNPSLPPAWYYPTTPAIAFLQKNAPGYRIAGLGDRLPPEVPSIYGLSDLRSSNPAKPYLVSRAVAPLTRSPRATKDVLERASHPLYQLFGVRYLVGVADFRRPAGSKLVFHDGTVRVYERADALARLFLPAGAEAASSAPWTDRVWGNADFTARALAAEGPWQAADPDGSRLAVDRIEASRLRARGRFAERRLVASSIYQDGGWRLFVNGRAHPTVLANGPFVAAWVGPGAHRFDLLYRAPGLAGALALAALALGCAVAWLLPRPSPASAFAFLGRRSRIS